MARARSIEGMVNMLNETERARRYIAKLPPAISGHGGHDATFHVAAILVWGFALPESDALMLLRQWNRQCLPPWTEAELIYKLKSASGSQHSLPRGWLLGEGARRLGTPHPAPPFRAEWTPVQEHRTEFRPDALKRIARNVTGIADVITFLAGRSAACPETQDSASVLRRLYARGSAEKVLIFSDMKSQGQYVWEAARSDVIQNRHLPLGDRGVWFLPQPVDGAFHPNPRLDKKMSRRSEESVTAWRYVVLESDKADADDWLRCLIQMPLRIACVCESGGRSIHALVRADASSKSDWDVSVGAIKPILVTLGADRGALSAVRLSRLPQAQRGEQAQRLLYLNPQPDGMPILQQPAQNAPYAQRLKAGI
jgi:hypothetical protein